MIEQAQQNYFGKIIVVIESNQNPPNLSSPLTYGFSMLGTPFSRRPGLPDTSTISPGTSSLALILCIPR